MTATFLRVPRAKSDAQLDRLAQLAGYANHLDATLGRDRAVMPMPKHMADLHYALWRMAASRDEWRRNEYDRSDQLHSAHERRRAIVTRLANALDEAFGDGWGERDHEAFEDEIVDRVIEVITRVVQLHTDSKKGERTWEPETSHAWSLMATTRSPSTDSGTDTQKVRA